MRNPPPHSHKGWTPCCRYAKNFTTMPEHVKNCSPSICIPLDMYSPLTEEERDLVLYYINEIVQKYSQQHSGRNPYPTA